MAGRITPLLTPILLAILILFSATLMKGADAQSGPRALYISSSPDAVVTETLKEAGYRLDESRTVPSNLSEYNLVVAGSVSPDFQYGLDSIRKYVRDGGGYVYISGSAYWSVNADNARWLGAGAVDYTGKGESAFISIDNPLGARLVSGEILKQQPPEEQGAQFVSGLQPGATKLAEYSGGGVYAYFYNYGDGKVYFQADINPSADKSAEPRIKELLSAGMKWASGRATASAVDMTVEKIVAGTNDRSNYAPGDQLKIYAKVANTGSLVIEQGCIKSDMTIVDRSGEPAIRSSATNSDALEPGGETLLASEIVIPSNTRHGWYSMKADIALSDEAKCGGYGDLRSLTKKNALLVVRPDSLPSGTRVIAGYQHGGEDQKVFFENPGPMSKPLPQPESPVKGMYASVTTYIQDATVGFRSGGSSYSIPVPPDSNLLVMLPSPMILSDLTVTIADRGYPDNSANVAYFLPGALPEIERDAQAADKGSDGFLSFIVAGLAAAGAAIFAATRMTSRKKKMRLFAGVADPVVKDYYDKKEVMRELGDELGTDLNPARNIDELLDKFKQEGK